MSVALEDNKASPQKEPPKAKVRRVAGTLVYLFPVMLLALLAAGVIYPSWVLSQLRQEMRAETATRAALPPPKVTVPESLVERIKAELLPEIKAGQKPGPPPSADPALQKFLLRLEALLSRLERAEVPAKAAPPPRIFEAQDVYLVVLHTHKLQFNRDCSKALTRFLRNHGSCGAHRVGLTVAVTDQVEKPIVRLGDDIRCRDLTELNPTLAVDSHIEESLNEQVAAQLAALFDAASKSPRRLVLLASTNCPAPAAAGDDKPGGWQALRQARIDAVLIPPLASPAANVPPRLAGRAAGWPAFCGERGGVCVLLPRRADPDEMTALLYRKLRELAGPREESP